MESMIFKRWEAICISLIVLISGFLFPSINASSVTLKGEGGWWDNRQAIRVSIFDLEAGETLESCDCFYNGKRRVSSYQIEDVGSYAELMNNLSTAEARGYNITFGSGCKLDYLLRRECDKTSIKNLEIKNAYKGGQVTIHMFGYAPKNDDDNLVDTNNANYMYKFFSPLRYVSDDGVTFNYDENSSLSEYLTQVFRDETTLAIFESILNEMGFSLCRAGYAPLENDYVLVIEPVYWFLNTYDKKRNDELFYGTATEWAIHSQQTYGRFEMGEYGGISIHSVMGPLTAVAGPLSCYPTRKDRIFTINDSYTGETVSLEFKISGKGTNIFENALRWQTGDKSSRKSIDLIDETIFGYLGVDFLQVKELYSLAVEQVNNSFRPNTEAVLSFTLESDSAKEDEFKPAYAGVAAYNEAVSNASNPDSIVKSDYYYGLKLVLTTTPDSDIDLDPVVLYCDGLPNIKDVDTSTVSTYAYTTWKVPNKTGVWRFTVDVYKDSGSKQEYISNTATLTNPEAKDDDSLEKEYVFAVTISDVDPEDPPNTSSTDLKPKGFSSPSGEITGYTPVTTLEWHTYSAWCYKTSDGQELVGYTCHRYSKSLDTDNTKIVTYDNVSSEETEDGTVTKSGYGIGVSAVSIISGDTDGLDGGCQSGVVLYPEYGYKHYGTLLESDGKGNLYMETNEYSKYRNDPAHREYSRVHFTPIWYPDGEYNVQVFLFDCWTPAGMLWNCEECTVIIDGAMYDDWYVTRR